MQYVAKRTQKNDETTPGSSGSPQSKKQVPVLVVDDNVKNSKFVDFPDNSEHNRTVPDPIEVAIIPMQQQTQQQLVDVKTA
ncbi:hypothetical protein A2U01_0003532 [Trifolium medium]|uniref:Uncharacterized protein n=1 Tax=Trifolium medium TaxID=97028 RepID=A0A392M5Z7_9FABA|nr:hypothetical protein [Trifolium medium]